MKKTLSKFTVLSVEEVSQIYGGFVGCEEDYSQDPYSQPKDSLSSVKGQCLDLGENGNQWKSENKLGYDGSVKDGYFNVNLNYGRQGSKGNTSYDVKVGVGISKGKPEATISGHIKF